MINRSCVCQGLLALTNNSWSDDGINKVEGCHGHGAAILLISLVEFIVWHELVQVTFRGVWSVWYMLKSWNWLVYSWKEVGEGGHSLTLSIKNHCMAKANPWSRCCEGNSLSNEEIFIPCPYDFLSVRYRATHTGKGKSSVAQCSTGWFKKNS